MMRHRWHKCPSESHPQMTAILLEGIFVIWNREVSQLSPGGSRGWTSKRDFPEGRGSSKSQPLDSSRNPVCLSCPTFVCSTFALLTRRASVTHEAGTLPEQDEGSRATFRRRVPRSSPRHTPMSCELIQSNP